VAKHDYASTQFNLPSELADEVKRVGKQIGAWALADEGIESEPHVTALYGLHENDPDSIRSIIEEHSPFEITLGTTSHFPSSGDGDVIKIEVIGRGLHELHKKLKAAPHTDTHPDYRPHVTLAYVKPGLGGTLSGDSSLKGKTAIVDHIVFSSKDGKKTKINLLGDRSVVGRAGSYRTKKA
jgi:2'-5' RNA ligase